MSVSDVDDASGAPEPWLGLFGFETQNWFDMGSPPSGAGGRGSGQRRDRRAEQDPLPRQGPRVGGDDLPPGGYRESSRGAEGHAVHGDPRGPGGGRGRGDHRVVDGGDLPAHEPRDSGRGGGDFLDGRPGGNRARPD